MSHMRMQKVNLTTFSAKFGRDDAFDLLAEETNPYAAQKGQKVGKMQV